MTKIFFIVLVRDAVFSITEVFQNEHKQLWKKKKRLLFIKMSISTKIYIATSGLWKNLLTGAPFLNKQEQFYMTTNDQSYLNQEWEKYL